MSENFKDEFVGERTHGGVVKGPTEGMAFDALPDADKFGLLSRRPFLFGPDPSTCHFSTDHIVVLETQVVLCGPIEEILFFSWQHLELQRKIRLHFHWYAKSNAIVFHSPSSTARPERRWFLYSGALRHSSTRSF